MSYPQQHKRYKYFCLRRRDHDFPLIHILKSGWIVYLYFQEKNDKPNFLKIKLTAQSNTKCIMSN
jgi:hypothetical protein